MASDNQEASVLRPGPIIGGAVLLLIGGTMFLDRTGVADVRVGQIIGPACLIILGSLMLVERGAFVCGRREQLADRPARMNRRQWGGLTGGLWLLGVGCWMLVSQLHLFGLDYQTSWPLLLILSGTIILARGVR